MEVLRYLQRQAKDGFAAKAREHSYRARSAFKLIEIDDRFRILKPGSIVMDVGCAPGSWLQVAAERCQFNRATKGPTDELLLGIDLQHVLPVTGAEILSLCDVSTKEAHEKIRQKLAGREVDVVLCDMAPNPTGERTTDHLRLIALCRTVFHLFTSPNKVFEVSSGGTYVCKIWDGEGRSEYVQELRKRFDSVKTVKPTACRENSAELYLVCKGFRSTSS